MPAYVAVTGRLQVLLFALVIAACETTMQPAASVVSSILFPEPYFDPTRYCATAALSPMAQKVHDAITASSVLENSPTKLIKTGCNSLDTVMVDGPAIFSALRDKIATAEHEVNIAFFAWEESSDAARLIGDGLKQAGDARGRSSGPLLVRILISDSEHALSGRTINHIYDSSKSWNLDPSKVRLQMATYPYVGLGAFHSKFVVIDDKALFVTGANPQGHHDAPKAPFNLPPWHDTGYIFSGPVSIAALDAFDAAWANHARNWTCRPRNLRRDCDDTRHANPSRGWIAAGPPHTGTLALLTVGRNAKELPNTSIQNPQDRAWLTLMSEAQTSINIETPNINDEHFQDAVIAAARRGVTVRLMTSKRFNDVQYNGPGEKNLEIVGRLRKRMWSTGSTSAPLHICWYSRDGEDPVVGNHPGANHTKFMSVDGQIAIVGSGNMDFPSWKNSNEFNILIDSAAEVSRIEKAFFNSDWSKANCSVVELYEGNNNTQDLVCSEPVLRDHSRNFNDSEQCVNDEARSIALFKIPAGRVIRLFDHPNGKTDDDWWELQAKREISEVRISTLHMTFENDYMRVVYHRSNGLDGKVSRITLSDSSLEPVLDFYEGNDGRQNLVCSVRVVDNHVDNFQSGSTCANDEARSVVLWNVPANRVVWLYDSPSGHTDDDWFALRTKRHIKHKVINSFQDNINDDDVEAFYYRNNGLDGKVSRIGIENRSFLSGYVSLYEGNNASQNKVCDLHARDRTVNFKEESSCDNDEARSVVLTNIRAGTRIYLYDDPDCESGDDWTKIEALQDVHRYVVNSVEQNSETSRVKVTHHHDNGLAGKVSCVKIRVP